jgi:hypothetical protein
VFDVLSYATLLGAIGAGQVAKLANQLIVATTVGAVAEALKLVDVILARCVPLYAVALLIAVFWIYMACVWLTYG